MHHPHWILLFLCFVVCTVQAKKTRFYNSYKGLVMAGYQGWFNAPTDGANRKWHHYSGPDGFRPGSCTIDFGRMFQSMKQLTKLSFGWQMGLLLVFFFLR